MFKVSNLNEITMSRGETITLVVPLYNSSAQQYEMAPTEHLEFRIARDEERVVIIEGSEGANEIMFTHDKTQNLMPGLYKYDIVLINPNSTYHYIVPPTLFTLLPTLD